jgi:hypothetical protein
MYLRRDAHIYSSYLRRDNTLHIPMTPKFPNESVSPQGYPYHMTQIIGNLPQNRSGLSIYFTSKTLYHMPVSPQGYPPV